MTDEYFTCVQSGVIRNLTKERASEQHRSEQISLAAHGARQHEIARICARHELESDEFYTAEQKALRYIRH